MEKVEYQPWSPKQIIDFLKEAKKRATTEHPIEFQLIKPELLPWEGMDKTPVKGTFVSFIEQPLGYGRIRRDIVVDFSRITSAHPNGVYTPYACFPVSAVKMSVGGELFIDCGQVEGISSMLPNSFIERSLS